MESDDEKWVKVGPAAEEAKVDPRTIRRWADKGLVRSRVSPYGIRQISLTSLRAMYERETSARRQPGAAGPSMDAEQATPDRAIPYLARGAEGWSRWDPSRLKSEQCEALLCDIKALTDALEAVRDEVAYVLRERDKGYDS